MKTLTFTPGQLTAIDKLIKAKGKDHQALQTLLANGTLADLLEADPAQVNREFLRRTLGLAPLEKNKYFVDYDMTLEEMIDAVHFNSPDERVDDKHFPIVGSGKVGFTPIIYRAEQSYFGKDEDLGTYMLQYMEERGSRPAKIEELLAYATLHPEKTDQSLIALGSTTKLSDEDGDEGEEIYVPQIYWTDAGGRELGFREFNKGGDTYFYLFLGVRK